MIEGQCVRLTQGDYAKMKIYYKDVLEAAKRLEDCGLQRLHMVDLEGAKSHEPKNLRALERVVTHTSMQVQYGGGIKDAEALRSVFDAGASRAICGSVAVSQPELFAQWLEEFGPDRIILGADVRGGKVAVKGWLEDSAVTIDDLLQRFNPRGETAGHSGATVPGSYAARIARAICTDIARDGMLCGPSVDFYTDLQSRYPEIEMIVSGGISCLDDIKRLDEAGLRSVIVGKAIYEGKITFKELQQCSLSA